MSKVFSEIFNVPREVYPTGHHISRIAYSREEASILIGKKLLTLIDPADLIKMRVRSSWTEGNYQHDNDYIRTWRPSKKGIRGSKPTWVYQPKEVINDTTNLHTPKDS